MLRLEGGRELVDQARLLPNLPLAVLREELELLGGVRARLQGPQARVIRAQEVGQHPGVKRIALRRTLAKPVPGPVQRLGIHRVDHDAMVEQEIHHPALGPLNRGPELEPLRSPLVQLPAPPAQALRGVRHRARGDLRPALIPHPHRVGLIRPVDAQIVAHGSFTLWHVPSSCWPVSGPGAGTAGYPYTGPPGDHFLSVGSRTGAVPVGSPWLSPPFPASCPCRVALGPSPAPAASNPACRFPAPGFPARFSPWVMRPIVWACFHARLQYLTL